MAGKLKDLHNEDNLPAKEDVWQKKNQMKSQKKCIRKERKDTRVAATQDALAFNSLGEMRVTLGWSRATEVIACGRIFW